MERLSAQDLITLWPERVGAPQDMGALALLDTSAPDAAGGSTDIGAVRQLVAGRLDLAPRLRQVVVTPPPGLGRPLWVDAPRFDIAQHVKVAPVPAPGTESQLLTAVEGLRRRPLDPSRPMWEMWLLPGLGDGRVGLYLRVHHVLADGPAVVSLLGAILTPAPLTGTGPAPPWTPAPPPAARDLLAENLHRCGAALGRGGSVIAHPSVLRSRLRAAAAAVRNSGVATSAPRSSLNRPIGHERRLAIVRHDLEPIRAAAHGYDASVNDVLLAAVSQGLRALLRGRGEPVDDIVLRAVVPIALPHQDEEQQRGNVLGQMIVPLPVGLSDAAECTRRIAAQTKQLKRSPAPRRLPVLRGRALQRAAMRVANHQRAYNVYVANIHGPATPLYLADAELLDVLPVVPLMGNLTLGVGALSYAGRFTIVCVGDVTTCPDVDVFADAVRTALLSLAGPGRHPV